MENVTTKIQYYIDTGLKQSPKYDDYQQALDIFKRTHRTAALWKTWYCPTRTRQRHDSIQFKVVYSRDQLRKMHPNQLRQKWLDYKENMTPSTLSLILEVAAKKRIELLEDTAVIA